MKWFGVGVSTAVLIGVFIVGAIFIGVILIIMGAAVIGPATF